MKVIEAGGETIMSGDMPTMEMGISNDLQDQLMILNVLSNTLYTNKVAAVLREYGCNAYDANVEAGRADVPIEITLPNKIEATVRIRDNGFGMTQEQIAGTFCRLGRSTKRNSNEFTGMLGIGSKAGFAYGDSFTVSSYTGGTRTVYNAFRDKGVPRLALMFTGPTTEKDGIEIKVPVKIADVEEFTREAQRTFRYFKVPPMIGGQKVDLGRPDVILSGNRWRYTGTGRSVAIMGNVGYTLDSTAMGVGTLTVKEANLLQCGLELDFNIGDLEISANREGLQYKDTTKASVKALLKSVSVELGKKFSDDIAGATTMWEAKMLYGKLFEQTGNNGQSFLREAVDGDIKWGGEVLKSSKITMREALEEVGRKGKGTVTVHHFRTRYGSRIERNPNITSFNVNESVTIVLNDLPNKSGSPARVRGHFNTVRGTDRSLVVFTFSDSRMEQEFLKTVKLEGAPFIFFSTIAPAYSAAAASNGPSAHRSKHSARGFILDETADASRWPRSAVWSTATFDNKDGKGVYVQIEGFMVREPKSFRVSNTEPTRFVQDVRALRDSGLLQVPVYGMKQAMWGKLGPGWKTLEEHLAERLVELSGGTFTQEFTDYMAAEDFPNFMASTTRLKNLRADNSLRLLMTAHHKMGTTPRLALISFLRSGKGRPWIDTPPVANPTHDLSAMRKQVFKDYPLIETLWASGALTNIKDRVPGKSQDLTSLLNYIRLVDDAV